MELKRLDLTSASGSQINLDALYQIMPSCFTEVRDEKTGEITHKINFTTLRELLGDDAYEGADEEYGFTWVGKNAARQEAARPINKTLRPCPEESVDWDTTENLYIEGDNLEVLKLLQKSYLGKIKLIYIDPPYNTGNDFVYRDDFAMSADDYDLEAGNVDELGNRFRKNADSNARFHSDWCSMIYQRLLLARNLLKRDGLIFISINDKEVKNLKNICTEIFGRKNEVATLIWDKNHSAQAGIYKVYHEYILVYCKNIELLGDPTALSDDLFEAGALKKISGRHPASAFKFPAGTRFEAEDGTEFSGIYGGAETVEVVEGRMVAKNRKLLYDVTLKAGFTQANQMKQFFYGNREELVDSKGQKIVEFYFNSSGKIKIIKKRSVESLQTTCKFGTQGNASNELRDLFGLDDCPFSSPKPIGMIKDFILRFTEDDDIVLDFFSGSATTAHSLFEANSRNFSSLKFILVQLQEDLDESLKHSQKDAVKPLQVAIEYLDKIGKPHNICELGKERIRLAGKKVKEEAGEKAANLDIGFRVFKCEDSYMNNVKVSPSDLRQEDLFSHVENIKDGTTPLQQLFGCMLTWGVQLSLPLSKFTVAGKTVYNVNDGDLIGCFDEDINEEVISAIAELMPLRVVFRDSCFKEAAFKMNLFELFKQKCEWSEEQVRDKVRVI